MNALSISETFPGVLGVTHTGTLSAQSLEAYTFLSAMPPDRQRTYIYRIHLHALDTRLEPDTILAFINQGTDQQFHYSYTVEFSCRASS